MNKIVIFILSLLIDNVVGFSQNLFLKDETTWENILDISKKQHKFIFVDAYTSWCGPCKEMDKTVFTDSSVIAFYKENFINIKVDMEKGYGIKLSQKFNVHFFPTFLFIDSNENLIHRDYKLMSVRDFLQLGSNTINKDSQYYSQKMRYIEGERSSDFLRRLSYLSKNAFDDNFSKDVALSYVKSKKDGLDDENLDFIKEFTSTIDHPFLDIIFGNKELFVKRFGNQYVTWLEETILMNDVVQHSFGIDKLISMDKAKEYVKLNLKSKHINDEKLISKVQLRKYQFDSNDTNFVKFTIQHFDKYPSENSRVLLIYAESILEKTNDILSLKKAIVLAQKSINIDSNLDNNSILANLYYKIGDKEKAINSAKEAIRIGKKANIDCQETEQFLLKIQNN